MDRHISGKVALLAEGVDRNPFGPVANQDCTRSPSSRRAWIEIIKALRIRSAVCVALLAEGVDRNSFFVFRDDPPAGVALLAEGVDRNNKGVADQIGGVLSPSSRRAWIEILNGISLQW